MTTFHHCHSYSSAETMRFALSQTLEDSNKFLQKLFLVLL